MVLGSGERKFETIKNLRYLRVEVAYLTVNHKEFTFLQIRITMLAHRVIIAIGRQGVELWDYNITVVYSGNEILLSRYATYWNHLHTHRNALWSFAKTYCRDDTWQADRLSQVIKLVKFGYGFYTQSRINIDIITNSNTFQSKVVIWDTTDK